MSEEQHQRVEQVASAVEDLLLMGVIKLKEGQRSEAAFSPEFNRIASNIMSDMKIQPPSTSDQVMKMMYYSLLIFMTEQLKVPRSFMMALGNDMEKNRENMETGELVTTYVTVLAKFWAQQFKDSSKS
jgi:hypothetical protein